MDSENQHIAALRQLMDEDKAIVSKWMTIPQKDTDFFSILTDDWCDMHNDPVAAAPLGGTIVQGYHVMALLPSTMLDFPIPVMDGEHFAYNYGLNRVRMMNSLHCGHPFRVHSKVNNLVDKGGDRCLVTIEATVEIQNEDKPMLIAETLYYLGFDQPLG